MGRRTPPATRSDFALWRSLQTRWQDNDIYGHMNNGVHYQLFDTAINGWLIDNGLLSLDTSETIFIVAETGCRYHAELRFPGVVEAGLAVERLGGSSVVWSIGLFAPGRDAAAADGRFVHVYCRRDGMVPQPLPDGMRAAFAPLLT